MQEEEQLIPLGSVVTLAGSEKPLMVISRGVSVREQSHGRKYYDYGLCLYPEGLIGDLVIYSNYDNINEVLFQGYETPASIAHSKAITGLRTRNLIDNVSPEEESIW